MVGSHSAGPQATDWELLSPLWYLCMHLEMGKARSRPLTNTGSSSLVFIFHIPSLLNSLPWGWRREERKVEMEREMEVERETEVERDGWRWREIEVDREMEVERDGWRWRETKAEREMEVERDRGRERWRWREMDGGGERPRQREMDVERDGWRWTEIEAEREMEVERDGQRDGGGESAG